MRPMIGTALALALVLAGPASGEERGLRPWQPDDPPMRDAVPPRNDLPHRATLRNTDGAAAGYHDRGAGRSRGIARDTDGTAVGTVAPSRSGGGVVRGTDGSLRGLAPARPAEPTFRPRSSRR